MLFKPLLRWRVGIEWYLFVLFWPPVLSLVKTAIAILFGSAAPDFSQPAFVRLSPLPPELLKSVPFLMFLPVIFLQQLLIGSSMGEEIGWRGYALPRLQANQGSLRGSILLGILWGIWHLPLWLTKGNAMQGNFLLWPLLELIATSILFTWVYNNTQGSLLLAVLFHTSIATTSLFLASVETYPLVDVVLTWAMPVLVIFHSARVFKTQPSEA
jgi:membrane protease YdiL (CAAX protease family)